MFIIDRIPKKDTVVHNLCFFWIKKLFARAENPYSNMMVQYLSEMLRLVVGQAGITPNVGQRLYLDALAAVLGKALENIPNFFPSVDTNEKKRIVRSFMVNYDLIHIDHELEVSMLTGLRKDVALTADAITRFYTEKARYRQGNTRSPLTGVKAGDDLANRDVLARLQRENVRCPQRDTQSPHAVVLYKMALYHYNYTNPDAPALTDIAINVAAQPQRKEAYTKLQSKLSHLPKDHIYRAEQEREWMATLLVNVRSEKTWRHINLRLVMEFLARFEPLLNKSAQDWRDTKKGMAWLAISAALLAGVLGLMWVLFPLAKIVVLIKFAMLPVLAVGVLGLGLSAYSYVQEKFYQKMLADFTQIDYAKTYPAVNQQPAPVCSVKKSFASFFKDHQEILEPAFPLPVNDR